MPFRTKHSYSTSQGTTVVGPKGAKTFAGKGAGPAGTRKVRPATAATAPTVTMSATGTVTASGFASPAAATTAKRASRASKKRVRRIIATTEAEDRRVLLGSNAKARQRRNGAAGPSVGAVKGPAASEIVSSRPSAPRRVVPASPPASPKSVKRVFSKIAAVEGGATSQTGESAATTKAIDAIRKRWEGKTGASLGDYNAQTGRPIQPTQQASPKVRAERKQVKGRLRQARRAVRRSGPNLAGLSPAEHEVAKLAKEAHRRYPAVPVSVLMGDTKQESGFNAAAVSSAGAQGLTQFIPSTAASYGVKFGTGKAEKRSQVLGQAHLLSDNLKQSGSITEALNDYLGLHGQSAPSEYSAAVLANAKAYTSLDKPGSPAAIKRLKAVKAEARKLGINLGGVGKAPKRVVTRYHAGLTAIHELTVAHIPYVWGGGHGGFTDPRDGEDCSGAVSYVLHKMGVTNTPLTSGDMGTVLQPGPGVFTVFYNAGHTFVRVLTPKGPVYWGTSVGDSDTGGLGPHPTPSAAYLAQYNVGHVAGLGKKQALQLGLPSAGALTTSSPASFPGITLAPGGTTATIDPGATTQRKPGFSSKPIKLTQSQKAHRTLRELKSLGAGVGEGKKEEAPSRTGLKELERKYGSPAV